MQRKVEVVLGWLCRLVSSDNDSYIPEHYDKTAGSILPDTYTVKYRAGQIICKT